MIAKGGTCKHQKDKLYLIKKHGVKKSFRCQTTIFDLVSSPVQNINSKFLLELHFVLVLI